MKIRKFNDSEKLNESTSPVELKEKLEAIWKHYNNIGLEVKDGRFVICTREGHMFMSTNANDEGTDIINCYLSGIISGLLMAGKDVDYPPKKIKRKISKIDPYGEEDWEN